MHKAVSRFDFEKTSEVTVVGFLKNGHYLVEKNEKLNVANKEGQLLCDYWFVCLEFLENEIAKVKEENKGWNFINQQGELLVRNLWFDFVGDYKNGLARVKKVKLWNFINQQGELINAVWFNVAFDFQANGLALVKQYKTWYFLDKQGRLTQTKLPKTRVWLEEKKEES